MRSLALNLIVAVIWLFLHEEPSLITFVIGFIIGFALLSLFRSLLASHDYVRRMIAAWAFMGVFSWAFLTACIELIRFTLFVPVKRMRPEFIIYDVSKLSRLELILLSHCVTLTPGTRTVDISEDFTRLYLHVLDCPDADAVRVSIDQTLKRGILAFTR